LLSIATRHTYDSRYLLSVSRYFEIIKVEVIILDINDNSPMFSPSRLTLSVSESTAVPKELLAIMPATDADSPLHGIVGYQLMSRPDDNSLFGLIVNGSSSVTATSMTRQQQHPYRPSATVATALDLRLVVLRPLDYETTEIHHLQLIAFDSPSGDSPSLSGTLYIDLLVTDSNDNAPRFDNASYSALIWETAKSQSTVTAVHATDLDSGLNGRVKYKFSKRTLTASGNMFTLDAETGVIRLAVDGYQLAHTDYVLAVLAEDHGENPLSSMVSVTVTVLDVNQHAPSITVEAVNVMKSAYDINEVDVIEHGRANSTVAVVTATDADKGDNGLVTCRLTSDGYGQFSIIWLYDTAYKIVNTRPLNKK
jgi:protocadherin delta 1